MRGWRGLLLTALVALVAGFGGAALFSASGLGQDRTRAYLLANPDILPEMAEAYQRQQRGAALGPVADAVREPFPGAVLGNPNGSRTLVEFTDYGCTFCRRSVADVEALVAADPELRVVIREWPIFDGSEGAARMALAAAKQGRFAAFHRAMFAAGQPSPEAVAEAARSAGLDMARAERDAASPEVDAELATTRDLAQRLGFSGTPSWVAGDEVVEGAVGRDALAEALGG